MTTTHLSRIILGLGTYFYPANTLPKQKRVIRCRTRKLRKLKLRRYTSFFIDINDYLSDFPGEKSSDKIVNMELNEIFLNVMPNGWSKQAYAPDFDFEGITK